MINYFLKQTKKNHDMMINKLKLLTLLSVVITTICTSCNVTRKVTTQSEYLQRGDTSVMIVTKTIESYDATKKIN